MILVHGSLSNLCTSHASRRPQSTSIGLVMLLSTCACCWNLLFAYNIVPWIVTDVFIVSSKVQRGVRSRGVLLGEGVGVEGALLWRSSDRVALGRNCHLYSNAAVEAVYRPENLIETAEDGLIHESS